MMVPSSSPPGQTGAGGIDREVSAFWARIVVGLLSPTAGTRHTAFWTPGSTRGVEPVCGVDTDEGGSAGEELSSLEGLPSEMPIPCKGKGRGSWREPELTEGGPEAGGCDAGR